MDVKINIKLKEIRESKGLSLRQLEELTGVSNSQISAIELGQSLPGIHNLCCLAIALEVGLNDLVDYHL